MIPTAGPDWLMAALFVGLFVYVFVVFVMMRPRR